MVWIFVEYRGSRDELPASKNYGAADGRKHLHVGVGAAVLAPIVYADLLGFDMSVGFRMVMQIG